MTQPSLSSLYQQLILEHYRHPRNKAELPDSTVEAHAHNRVCGDEIKLQLRVEGDEIADVRFVGQGCSISQASVSMMTALVRGSTRGEALALADRFIEMMHGSQDAATDRCMGDLRALQGVSKFPVRIKCALLGFDALRDALGQAEGGQSPSTRKKEAAH